MAMAQDPKGREKLQAEGVEVPPVKVAQEFLHADHKKRLRDAIMGKKA
jgi:hypothetical protein